MIASAISFRLIRNPRRKSRYCHPTVPCARCSQGNYFQKCSSCRRALADPRWLLRDQLRIHRDWCPGTRRSAKNRPGLRSSCRCPGLCRRSDRRSSCPRRNFNWSISTPGFGAGGFWTSVAGVFCISCAAAGRKKMSVATAIRGRAVSLFMALSPFDHVTGRLSGFHRAIVLTPGTGRRVTDWQESHQYTHSVKQPSA
jgi:hypothetical protein